MLAYALAALSGALYFLGFAGFDLWPLALVALVPLMWVLDPTRGPLSRKALIPLEKEFCPYGLVLFFSRCYCQGLGESRAVGWLRSRSRAV